MKKSPKDKNNEIIGSSVMLSVSLILLLCHAQWLAPVLWRHGSSTALEICVGLFVLLIASCCISGRYLYLSLKD